MFSNVITTLALGSHLPEMPPKMVKIMASAGSSPLILCAQAQKNPAISEELEF